MARHCRPTLLANSNGPSGVGPDNVSRHHPSLLFWRYFLSADMYC